MNLSFMYILPIKKKKIKLKVKSCLKLGLNVFDLVDHHQSEKHAYARCSNTAGYVIPVPMGEQNEVQ